MPKTEMQPAILEIVKQAVLFKLRADRRAVEDTEAALTVLNTMINEAKGNAI